MSLRHRAVFRAVRAALCGASTATFRVLEFSTQRDHVHLVVEADDTRTLSRGVQGLAVRVARAVNRALGRSGSVWDDRYHARELRTPREVRNALAYVLRNWLHHVPGARGIDPCSSAMWFRGRHTSGTPSPLPPPRTWLARIGWRRAGPIDVAGRAGRRDTLAVIGPLRSRGAG